MIEVALLFAGTALVSVGAGRLSVRLLGRLGVLDHPNERSSHEHPTPRGGGIGILLAFAIGAAVGAWRLGPGLEGTACAVVVVAMLCLAALGARDDRCGVRPLEKLALQLLASTGVVVVVGGLTEVALPGGPVALGMVGSILSVLWLVAVSNGYNFMDGIDGIAALFAGVAGLFFSAAVLLAGGDGVLWLSVPAAAASLGFLAVNWSPAKVFMGDVGSLPIGFLLALTAILSTRAGVPFLSGFLFLGPFLFDTAFTILSRAARRENLLSAHRSHLYQRLVGTGWTHARVSVMYGGWTVLTGGLGLLYVHGSAGGRALALIVAAISGLVMVLLVRRRERKVGAIR